MDVFGKRLGRELADAWGEETEVETGFIRIVKDFFIVLKV